MEMHQFRYFVAAARAGSVSEAARACGVAQPSLSQQIRRLEEAVGARLFDRVPRGVVLTDEGRALLPRAERILAEAEAISASLMEDVASGVGRLAVGAIPTMAPFLLPGVVAGLREAYPRAAIEVREDLTEGLVRRVVEGSLDAAVMSTPIDEPWVEIEVVREERLLVLWPRSWGVATEECSVNQLREAPRVSLDEVHCLGRQVAGFCARRKIGAGSIACRATQLSTLIEMVAEGLGVALVPEMALQGLDGARVHAVPLASGGAKREIAVITRRNRTRTGVLLSVLELVRREADRQAAIPGTATGPRVRKRSASGAGAGRPRK